jgi:5-methylcytosine-specific restriction enzyme subunit McrC
MQIPIENIYYLLCYAWNKLDEKDRVNVSIDDKTELLDLFAKVLINATKTLLKRGIDKNYIDYTEEIAGVKGKVQISQTLKGNLLLKQRTVCTYDAFTSNVLLNRILVTTLYRLTRTKGLDNELKYELVALQRMLADIEQIEITSSLFKKVILNRNNRFYGFIMNVCQIIHENTLPSEEKGKYKFSDFTRDDNKMNQLFEAFVRNFYRIEQKKYPS